MYDSSSIKVDTKKGNEVQARQLIIVGIMYVYSRWSITLTPNCTLATERTITGLCLLRCSVLAVKLVQNAIAILVCFHTFCSRWSGRA